MEKRHLVESSTVTHMYFVTPKTRKLHSDSTNKSGIIFPLDQFARQKKRGNKTPLCFPSPDDTHFTKIAKVFRFLFRTRKKIW